MTLTPQYIELSNHRRIVMHANTRVLYTDGSYDHGVAGWAVVENNECILQDWSRGLTSNLAEGLAILDALYLVKRSSDAYILSDSLAWVNAFNGIKRMKGKPSLKVLEEGLTILHPDIQIVWVPGHTGRLTGNTLADEYARQARVNKICTEDLKKLWCG